MRRHRARGEHAGARHRRQYAQRPRGHRRRDNLSLWEALEQVLAADSRCGRLGLQDFRSLVEQLIADRERLLMGIFTKHPGPHPLR